MPVLVQSLTFVGNGDSDSKTLILDVVLPLSTDADEHINDPVSRLDFWYGMLAGTMSLAIHRLGLQAVKTIFQKLDQDLSAVSEESLEESLRGFADTQPQDHEGEAASP